MGYIGGIIFAAIICGGLVYWAKKTAEETKALVDALTEEQALELQRNEVENYDEKKFTWCQKAFIAKVIDKNKNVALKVLWYNTIIQNGTLNQCQLADIKMKKSDFEAKNLKEGSYVKIFIDPQNANAEIV